MGTSGAGGELQEAGEVRVWDAETWKPLKPLPVKAETKYGEWASAADVAVSPDGRWVATAGSDKVVRVWSVETGKELAAMSSPKGITTVAYRPDGRFLAAGSEGGSVRIWGVGVSR